MRTEECSVIAAAGGWPRAAPGAGPGPRRPGSRALIPVRASVCALLIVVPGVVSSQVLQPRFGRVTVADGLASYRTYDAVQDSIGFLWIGTQEGLDRFDGYSMRLFHHDDLDSASISEDLVRSLLVDRHGTLWAGTDGQGLNRFDGHAEHFTRFTHRAGDAGSISPGRITALCEGKSGSLWIGTRGGGLNRLDEGSVTFHHFTHDSSRTGSLASDRVYALFEDAAGSLWVGTDGGVSVLDETSGVFTHYRHAAENPKSLSSDHVRAIAADDSGTIWVGTEGGGLNRLDRRSGQFARFVHDGSDPQSIGHDDVSCICPDGPGSLWVGISDNEGGLNRLDTRTGRFTRFRNDPLNPHSLLHNYVRKIRRDRSGVVWIVTDRGLSKFDPRAGQFRHYVIDRNPLAVQNVYAVAESRGTLWIGSNGLRRAVARGGEVLPWRTSRAAPLNADAGTAILIHEDRTGALWVGTTMGGLEKLDVKRGTGVHYALDVQGRTTYPVCVLEDGPGALWIGTSDAGLLHFDFASGSIVRYGHSADESASLAADGVYCLYRDRCGVVWVGTDGGGLDRFTAPGNFAHCRHNPSDPLSLGDDRVYEVAEDPLGRMWIASKSGIQECDRSSGSFRTLAPPAGKSPGVINRILFDGRGRLWMSTMQNGIWRLDPGTGEFRSFDEKDGLQCNHFSDAALKLGNGEFIFGGEKGLTIFHPDSIRDNPCVPVIILTSFAIFGHPLGGTLTDMHDLHLKYDQNYFSFEFAALDLSIPEKNRYAYRLDGVDTGWVYPAGRRYASYTNIDPGTYALRVKGSNNDGVWNESGLSIPVTITPPYWATWWFRSLAALAVIGILAGAYMYRVSKLLEMERMRLRIATDLHDDIGSSLGSIALVTDMVRRTLPPGAKSAGQLQDASTAARRTADSLRDIVWLISPDHDRLDDIVLRMKDAAAKLLAGIEYTFDCPEEALGEVLDMEFRRHVWLIYKESLHNISKYAKAHAVGIEVKAENGVFHMRIKDDGVGFDPSVPSSGNGMRNLRARAAKLGGTIGITSAPCSGTTVTLEAKIP